MLWYDHFVAKGGAEQVSLQLAEQLQCQVCTAWADTRLFADELGAGLLKHQGHDYLSALLPTFSLMLFFSWSNAC